MFKPAIFNIKQLRWSVIWWHVVKALDCELCSELMSINDPLCTAREWRGSAEVIRVLLFCIKHMEAGGYKNATGFYSDTAAEMMGSRGNIEVMRCKH